MRSTVQPQEISFNSVRSPWVRLGTEGVRPADTRSPKSARPSDRPPSNQRTKDRARAHETREFLLQQLADEEDEYAYCETILKDNDRHFRHRVRELKKALADVHAQNDDEPHSMEDIVLKEEAVLHLQSTLNRLEREEQEQGQAVAELAESLGCGEAAQAAALNDVRDSAEFVRTSLFSSLADAREACTPCSVSTVSPLSLGDARLLQGTHFGLSEMAPVLQGALLRVSETMQSIRCDAMARLDALIASNREARHGCERLSEIVRDAQSTMTELKAQRAALQHSLESTKDMSDKLEMQSAVAKSEQRALSESLESFHGALTAGRHRLTQRQDALHQVNKEVTDVKLMVEEVEYHSQNQIQQLNHNKETCRQLQNDLDALERQRRTLETSLHTMNEAASQRRVHDTTLRSKLTALRQQAVNLGDEANTLEHERMPTDASWRKEQHAKNGMKKAIEALEVQIDEVLRELGELQQQEVAQKASKQAQTAALDGLLSEVSSEEAIAASLEDDLNNLRRHLLRPPERVHCEPMSAAQLLGSAAPMPTTSSSVAWSPLRVSLAPKERLGRFG